MPTYPDTSRSQELYKRAGELIPGWTQLISRRADQFANGVSPIYAQRAKGSRFIDIDENEYIDWVNAVGAIILGHADDVVDGAVKEQIERGSLYTLNSPLEIELAEELCQTIPSAQMVRYTKGGGEACAVAARIARGTSGRDKILICGYHGWHDWYQAANYGVDPESGEYPFAGIEPIGVPKALAGTIVPFSYGNLEMLESLLKQHAGEVAAIMMEPARSELPPPGYLEGVQALARQHDVILIFDEVSCGWRQAIGGIQSVVGVTPDMTVVAKAKRRNSEERLRQIGEKLRAALNGALAEAGLPGKCAGIAANPYLALDLPKGVDSRKVSTLFIQEMARRGVHTYMSFKATLAHSETDIAHTAAAAKAAFAIIKSAIEHNEFDKLLVADVKKEPFRRQVR